MGPLLPSILAQKERFLAPPSGCGLLRLEPVSLFILRLPDSLRPPLADLSEALKDTEADLIFTSSGTHASY
jgi:hypothetical protein